MSRSRFLFGLLISAPVAVTLVAVALFAGWNPGMFRAQVSGGTCPPATVYGMSHDAKVILVSNTDNYDNIAASIMVMDRVTGTTTAVGRGRFPAISADGNIIAFIAPNGGPGELDFPHPIDVPSRIVDVWSRQTGTTQRYDLGVLLQGKEAELLKNNSYFLHDSVFRLAISPNGRYVVAKILTKWVTSLQQSSFAEVVIDTQTGNVYIAQSAIGMPQTIVDTLTTFIPVSPGSHYLFSNASGTLFSLLPDPNTTTMSANGETALRNNHRGEAEVLEAGEAAKKFGGSYTRELARIETVITGPISDDGRFVTYLRKVATPGNAAVFDRQTNASVNIDAYCHSPAEISSGGEYVLCTADSMSQNPVPLLYNTATKTSELLYPDMHGKLGISCPGAQAAVQGSSASSASSASSSSSSSQASMPALNSSSSSSRTPDVCVPICGDGLTVGGEQCDDGNTTDGDGCSALCGSEQSRTASSQGGGSSTSRSSASGDASSRASSATGRSSSPNISASPPPGGSGCAGFTCGGGEDAYCATFGKECVESPGADLCFECGPAPGLVCTGTSSECDVGGTAYCKNTFGTSATCVPSSEGICIACLEPAQCSGTNAECINGGSSYCATALGGTCTPASGDLCIQCEPPPQKTAFACLGNECRKGGAEICAAKGLGCVNIPDGECITCAAEPGCESDLECAGGSVCRSGACVVLCGNGRLDSGEACDGGSGCSSRCTLEESQQCTGDMECASGLCIKNVCVPCTADSQCQSNDCRNGVCRQLCGNGQLDAGEVCDPGLVGSSPACTNECVLTQDSACVKNADCQTGLCVSGVCTGCRNNAECPASNLCISGRCTDVCGNGARDVGEQCDDGNRVTGDGCSRFCEHEPRVAGEILPVDLLGNILNNNSQTSARGQSTGNSGNTGNGDAEVRDIATTHPAAGKTGPAAVIAIAGGAAAGWSYMRRKRKTL